MRMGETAYAEDMAKLSAAVEASKQVPVWNQNKRLCDWFLRTWLKQQKDRELSPVTTRQSETYKNEKKNC